MDDAKAGELIARRHPEWREHQLSWRWLMDSMEGGERYRQAIYGTDTRGFPVRNLVRHKREYPDQLDNPTSSPVYVGGTANGLAGMVGDASRSGNGPWGIGSDATSIATIDDYEYRRARTPIPTFLKEVVLGHIGKVYEKEIVRDLDAIPDLAEWAKDVDGLGTTLDEWMGEVIGPMLMALGQLDVVMDHPPADPSAVISSQADVIRLGLNRCVASYILPENMLWWRLDAARRYAECLVREYRDPGPDDAAPTISYRHWIGDGWTLYDSSGKPVASGTHRFGRPPIERLFDRRKGRCRNVGQPRYIGVADRQREYYNRDSELILSDTLQAHPLIQGPEDYVNADGSIPVGPSWLLPKKKVTSGATITYEGFDVIEFPKDAAESIRRNKYDIREDVDREACLTKPAGSQGGQGKVVAQSGLSKSFDHKEGNAKLAEVSRTLMRAERKICEMALVVLSDSPDAAAGVEKVSIAYPAVFDLMPPEDLLAAWQDLTETISTATGMVETNAVAFGDFVRKLLPGRDDDFYATADEEIREILDANAERSAQAREMYESIEAAGDAADAGKPASDDAGDDEDGSEGTWPTPPVMVGTLAR